jgi:thiamine biosynthesis lipoprotein
MGTTWDATLCDSKRSEVDVRNLIQGRLDELEAIFTNWRAESPVSRFNASRNVDWQPVPRELVEVVRFAREISEATDGAFDVTCAPLLDLWGFGAKGHVKTPPSEKAIQEVKAHCGWQKLEFQMNPPTLRKMDPELQINVSALVEGYAGDDLKQRLIDLGITNFLLNSGEFTAHGQNGQGAPWTVGIQEPDAIQGKMVTAIPLTNQAMATSGTYRQFFEFEGVRYPHVLDARTGKPVVHHLPSVSVISDSCLIADGWATALLILGPIEGPALAKKHGISAFFLESKEP